MSERPLTPAALGETLAPTGSKRANWLGRTTAIAIGLALPVLVAELVARFRATPAEAGGGTLVYDPGHAFHPRTGLFLLDGEEGFRPSPTNPDYGAHGALANEYPLERTSGVPRVLCLGDSVTARGAIVDALAVRAPGTEWWNAGVEGWATAQEAAYLERIGPDIQPDLVVLFLHLNDFAVTPVNFLDDQGRLVMFEPTRPHTVSPFWFRHSALYRAYVAWSAKPHEEEAVDEGVSEALDRMKRECENSGYAFAVAVLPPFAPPGKLNRKLQRLADQRRQHVLDWCAYAGVTAYDLRQPVVDTAAAGLEVAERPGDAQHPSRASGDACAAFLVAEGLLELLEP
jgi:hypothetical protein